MSARPCALLAAFLVTLATVAATVSPAYAADDGPLTLDRYAGSTIVSEEMEPLDFYDLVVGYDAKTNQLVSKRVHGKVTRSVYNNPRDRSILEIYQSYARELDEDGLEKLFECEGDACGKNDSTNLWSDLNGIKAFTGPGSRYLAGTLDRGGKHVYVALMVGSLHTQVDVIETSAFPDDLLAVNADALAAALATHGRAILHGIYFDSGKATLKPESKDALEEIAKFLRQQPDLRVYVVGHTDSVGPIEVNMKLSLDRAAAVVSALETDYGIAAGRLSAYGVGPLSPATSNGTREGRSKNRRVELVEH
jgi:OOP family OmpA-OmpF porin